MLRQFEISRRLADLTGPVEKNVVITRHDAFSIPDLRALETLTED